MQLPGTLSRSVLSLRTACKAVLDVLLPPSCAACDTLVQDASPLCGVCLRVLDSCQIDTCELPGVTPAGRPVWAITYYRKGSPMRAVHRAAKYDQSERSAEWLGSYLATRMDAALATEWHQSIEDGDSENELNENTIVVPVPSHPARLLDRGLDTVHILATAVACSIGGRVETDLIRRTRLGTPQNNLDRAQRLMNVKSVFAPGPQFLTPSRIILIDDVVTTGATLDACADLLEQAGHHVALVALAFRRELFRTASPERGGYYR